MPTLVFSFAEDGFVLGDGHQSDVVVVDDVPRVLEAVVGAQEVVDRRQLRVAELVAEDDVEDLRGSFVVLRQASVASFLSSAVELPVDALHRDEYQPQQLVQNGRHETLNYQQVSCCLHCSVSSFRLS